ncbi:SbcC/MukB-like Walker B domain-containing protein [Xylocopilactobacillus apicola]|uniref:Chromosome segregation ATPase n=1 Tax=Xylocopilactobacillus apicola TaxID=2932184 RepID=A0AAU9DCF9_9LACO|nr:SbcC/MukB-like Walker B domain-containing protein [Xylocopilactobacillus apicola]BDR58487.1 chromosome segregation ATPase [Xylocopilactobacillus apicola]
MNLFQHLVPTSFHLRQFNKYVKLDLSASKAGNITFIGENAVGKTTLANCFFPMLIDGAISTPSFNAAKGIDKLNQDINPRNSARDTRNFESMLLGWGAGAMKVRTGYSYINLQSDTRQIILGLGATRIVGDNKKPTWWFIVISDELDKPINLVTTDQFDQGLNKEDFIQANKSLEDKLTVFDRALDYREFAAQKVYGFTDGETLGKLANVYRLLASPILTAGSARFTPIRDSLKNAQEGIDADLINKVANSQREVNRMNGVLEHLKSGQKRLDKIKQEIFWRNLNHLNEVLLDPYTENYHDFASEQIKVEQAQEKLKELNYSQQKLNDQLKSTNTHLDDLRFQKAEQKTSIELKSFLNGQIVTQNQQLTTFQKQQDQLNELYHRLDKITDQLKESLNVEKNIRVTELDPLKEKLQSITSQNLSTLEKLLATDDIFEFAAYLKTYLNQIKDANNQYQSINQTITKLGLNVNFVEEMKNQMEQQINERLQGPLSNRAHNRLIEDNRNIHDAGTSKINDQNQDLLNEQKEIIYNHPDLTVMIKHPELLTSLDQANKDLSGVLNKIKQYQEQQNTLKSEQNNLNKLIDNLKNQMPADLEVSELKNSIMNLKEKAASLKDNPEIDQALDDAEKRYHDYREQQQNLIQTINETQAEMKAAQLQMNRLKQKLTVLNAVIELDLKNLSPYFPNELQLATVDDLLNFVKQHRSEIKNNNFADLSGIISHLIHHNDQNGVDRNALDTIFEERGQGEIASAMRQQRTTTKNDLTVVAFDLNQALNFLHADEVGVIKALRTLETGNDVSQKAYEAAAINRITEQYNVIKEYNQILNEGAENAQSIKLKVELKPSTVLEKVIEEACDPELVERPALQAEIQQRLRRLANNTDLADDDEAFNEQAQELLDPRQWSNFRILIKRRQNNEDEYEEVDDKFVQSGGSGAEKAQAMVLPLLLVPKMLLQQANLKDAPYLVMFDEFADKLDPETAKSFAQTISHFGFSFIATMPNGAQNKILADGVENIAYEVIAPTQTNDGKFHLNNVYPALIWR